MLINDIYKEALNTVKNLVLEKEADFQIKLKENTKKLKNFEKHDTNQAYQTKDHLQFNLRQKME